jgi:hypothetical protein
MTVPQSTPLCKVFYDRSARAYIVRNGHEIARFPSGKANKTRAQWVALEHDAQQVASIARDLVNAGHDEGRVIRAARLVIEGKITIDQHDADFTRAFCPASEGNASPVTGLPHYQIIHNLTWGCQCHDYINRREDGERKPICKHILAAMIATRLADDFNAAAQRKLESDLDRAHALADGAGAIQRAYTYRGETKSIEQQRREARAGLGSALKSQHPRAGIGSTPLAWK